MAERAAKLAVDNRASGRSLKGTSSGSDAARRSSLSESRSKLIGGGFGPHRTRSGSRCCRRAFVLDWSSTAHLAWLTSRSRMSRQVRNSRCPARRRGATATRRTPRSTYVPHRHSSARRRCSVPRQATLQPNQAGRHPSDARPLACAPGSRTVEMRP